MFKRQVRIETVKDCDRTFILFGKSNSGKSALGNLLLGPHATTHFSIHPLPESSGHTKKTQSGEAEIDATLAYGECYTGSNTMKIQVIDQPGCNDNDYFSFSNQCLEEARTEKNITCLIVINLFAKFFSEDEFLTIMKITEILSENRYCVFSNAILVFTHADMIDKNLKNEKLEEKIHENLQKENYGYIRELLTVLGDRYIFVNAVNYSGTNRHNVLKKICQQSKSNLTVQINENHSFKGDELKLLLGGEAGASIIKETAPECDIQYCFSSNFKMIERNDDLNSFTNGMTNALNKLSCISNGISAIAILINLEEMFNEEIYNHIINLPNTYNLGDKLKHNFWEYACIVFKARMDSKDFVRRQIEANPKLKSLDRMVQSRYCWITSRSIPEECYERLGNLVKEVTSYNKLKIYTDSNVVTEMRDTMQESFMNRYSNDRETPPEIEREELLPEGRLCQPLSPRNALLSINNRFWITEHTGISTLIGYFIWKNINADIAKQFKIRYPEAVRISADAFIDFWLEFK